MVVGHSRVDLPMATIGAGCADVLIPSLDYASPVHFQVTIPNQAALVGFTFYAQGVLIGVAPCALDFPFTLSEAVQITVQ